MMYEPRVDDRVEWMPYGDIRIPGVVTHTLCQLAAVEIEGGQELIVEARFLRLLGAQDG